jgi:hypothetical protein
MEPFCLRLSSNMKTCDDCKDHNQHVYVLWPFANICGGEWKWAENDENRFKLVPRAPNFYPIIYCGKIKKCKSDVFTYYSVPGNASTFQFDSAGVFVHFCGFNERHDQWVPRTFCLFEEDLPDYLEIVKKAIDRPILEDDILCRIYTSIIIKKEFFLEIFQKSSNYLELYTSEKQHLFWTFLNLLRQWGLISTENIKFEFPPPPPENPKCVIQKKFMEKYVKGISFRLLALPRDLKI